MNLINNINLENVCFLHSLFLCLFYYIKYLGVVILLTPKQEKFCQCVASGMSYKDSYMTAYNCNSDATAINEGSKLALREDIQKHLETLIKPLQQAAQQTFLSEREKKRAVLWDLIQNGDDNVKCRALDILNKMDADYININHNINDSAPDISKLDTETLKRLSNGL